MGFWVTVYKIDRTLPDRFIERDLEVANPAEITPGIYKTTEIFHVEVDTLEQLKEQLEDSGKLSESDIVEWSVDEEALNNPSEELGELMRTESNYFIMKFWGLDGIAIEKEKTFVELTLQELGELFR